VKRAEERGIRLTVEHLAELHRIRALVPLLRILQRPSSSSILIPIADTARTFYRQVGTPLAHTIEAAGLKLLIDPGTSPYRRWDGGIKVPSFGGIRKYPSVFYSPYQLLGIRAYASLARHMEARRVGECGVKYTLAPPLSSDEIEMFNGGRMLATLLSALDVRYLPDISLTISHPDMWEESNASFDLSSRLSHFGVTAEQLADTADTLLSQARFIDPLGDWYDLVRQAHPSTWSHLKGDARLAMDYRIASEILLRAVDDLGRAELSTPPPHSGRRVRAVLDDRLHPDSERIEPALTSRGLYPAPAVILVLEGKTETLLMPRVLAQMLGRAVPSTLVQIVGMETIDRDLDLLVRREIAPRLGESQGDFVWLARPPTRMLVAVDPEKAYATKEMREEQRTMLVRRIYESLDPQYQTAASQREVDLLVEIMCWGKYPWEFANFTDAELAAGITSLVPLPTGTTNADLKSALRTERYVTNRSPNVERICKPWPQHFTKRKLAEILWPRLKAKIQADMRRGAPYRTPATRVGVRTLELALSTRRRNVVLPVK
jgi:hypothetical protein